MNIKKTCQQRIQESERVLKNLPLIQKLLGNDKISTKEKLRVLENTHINLEKYFEKL